MSSYFAGCCVQYLDAEVQWLVLNNILILLCNRSVSALDYLPIVIIYPTNDSFPQPYLTEDINA